MRSHISLQTAEVLKYWDHASGGHLSTRLAQKARQLEVVVERAPHSPFRARTGKEPIEVTG